MEYVNLGKTGLKVSRICLGCMTYGTSEWRPWVLNADESIPFFQRALELGINFFDTADMYSRGVSEEVTGRALKDVPRDEIVVATKVYQPMGDKPNQRGLSRKHIMESIDGSLRRLGMDYVDLYQIHRWDYTTPIEETLEALNDVIRAGKALPTHATEVIVRFRRPPLDVFDGVGNRGQNCVRFRLGPDVAIGLGARRKLAGEEMAGEAVELSAVDDGHGELDMSATYRSH